MSKPEWGEKRECSECGARFYDLKRDPIVCPKCDTQFVVVVEKAPLPPPEEKPAPAASSTPAESADESKATEGDDEVGELADIEIEDADNADDDDLIEDSVELDEDEDMSDVLDGAIDETKTAE